MLLHFACFIQLRSLHIRKSPALEPGAHSEKQNKRRKVMGLTDTTSSGAPFTIWNSLRMNPDGLLLPSFPLGGGGLGAAERLAVARLLMLVLFVSDLTCSVRLECGGENDDGAWHFCFCAGFSTRWSGQIRVVKP